MMLRESLVVHGADLEKLARKTVSDSGRLSWDREEDLLAELIAAAWELSEKHDEHRYSGQFAAGCYRRLRLRIVDWIRKTEGETHRARLVELLGVRDPATLRQVLDFADVEPNPARDKHVRLPRAEENVPEPPSEATVAAIIANAPHAGAWRSAFSSKRGCGSENCEDSSLQPRGRARRSRGCGWSGGDGA
jgi:hypothetical protein